MEPEQAQALGSFLRNARHTAGLSSLRLGRLTDIPDATIIRFEQGKFLNPDPDKLARIARALEVPVADVLSLADYPTVDELPSFTPYLRSKYRDLPDEAVEKIEKYVTRLAKKHGVALDGPDPGEDEQP